MNEWVYEENRKLRQLLKQAQAEIAELKKNRPTTLLVPMPYCPIMAEMNREERSKRSH